jgi:DNA-binding transcriptional ArsR family regulator
VVLPEPDAVFTALADANRRNILQLVVRDGPLTATSLAGGLPISRQAVAKHLAVLAEAGLVAAERCGREARFSATPEPLDDVTAWTADVRRRWDRRLDRLAQVARNRVT